MPCNVCIGSLERGTNPVALIWSEPNQFESLFNLQWPQREITSLRLFNRPSQTNRIHGDMDQEVYISGRFNLTQQFVDSGIDLAEFELCSFGHVVATIRIVGDEACVTPTGEVLRWESDDYKAFSTSFADGAAHIDWR